MIRTLQLAPKLAREIYADALRYLTKKKRFTPIERRRRAYNVVCIEQRQLNHIFRLLLAEFPFKRAERIARVVHKGFIVSGLWKARGKKQIDKAFARLRRYIFPRIQNRKKTKRD